VPEHLLGQTVKCPHCKERLMCERPGVDAPARDGAYHDHTPIRPPKPEDDWDERREDRRSRGDDRDDDDDDWTRRRRRSKRKAREMCLAPGIVFIVIAVLDIVLMGLAVLGGLDEIRSGEKDENTVPGIVFSIASILAAVVILLGGIQMIRLQTWGLVLAASILCLIPCISPCVIVGIPCGVWGLVVLFNGKVRDSFT
jgi:hypothetical protein